MTIADFLLARIAEDEAAAREPWGHDETLDSEVQFLYQRERVLAECEAKRQILGLAQYVEENEGGGAAIALFDGYSLGPSGVLPVLATVYASHPDYDQSWRP